jgi:predicted nucleic acid-binding protein
VLSTPSKPSESGAVYCLVSDGILDTSFFIDLRNADSGARELWDQIRLGSFGGAFSVVTPFELWVADFFDRDDELFFGRALASLDEAVLTRSAAARAGGWLRPFNRATRERRLRDALIAATAFERDEPVYTRNVRDFARFPVRVGSY